MITFVKTRWHYDSYTDFWSLVELSGFATIYVDEVDLESDNVYIVTPMNGEWRPHIDFRRTQNKKAQLIMWNLERPGSSSVQEYANGNHELIDRGYVDRVFVSDRTLAKDTGLEYVIVGGHEKLGSPGAFEDKKYDVIHLSCYSLRRSWLFDAPDRLRKMLANSVSVANNGWGDERHKNLQASKYMLCTHQDNYNYIAPQRFMLAAMYGLMLIVEPCDPFPYNDYTIPIIDMHKRVKLYDDGYDYQNGIRLRDFILGAYQFESCVRSVV